MGSHSPEDISNTEALRFYDLRLDGAKDFFVRLRAFASLWRKEFLGVSSCPGAFVANDYVTIKK